MIKAVIFDMDGTMIDTESIKENGWKYAGKCLGIEIDDAILSEIRGTNKKYIRELFGIRFNNVNFDELYQKREAFIKKNIEINGIKLKEGLMEILEFLKNNNYKIAVASSSHEKTIRKYLEKINILHYFDIILGGDMVKNGKPDPEIYLKAVELLNVPKEQCIGVEDSINGVLAVHRAGINAIMIPDLEKPNEEIESILYAELDSLLNIIDLLKNNERQK